MRGLITFIILFLMPFSVAAETLKETDISSCPQAFIKGTDGLVSVRPFNATICADDRLAQLTLELFPAASNVAAALFGLDNFNALRNVVDEKINASSTTVNLAAIESGAMTITEVFIPLA
ncbi:hypothetical protein, partial [Salinivibrio sp. SS2]|uniref:hypothetical protein n=1 Tax=Salinivibrio sp. SS2 TaxID=1892894 RepID=UPI001C30CA89